MLRTEDKQILPAGCGCGTSASLPRGVVYAVGSLSFDFGTEARRDAMYAVHRGAPFVTDAELASFLEEHPWEAESLIWTLSSDKHAIYAIRPDQTYGREAYAWLTGVLKGRSSRVSVPGWMAGSIRLMNGVVIPVIEPDLQGLHGWSTGREQPITISGPEPVADHSAVDLTKLGGLSWAYWGVANKSEHAKKSDGFAIGPLVRTRVAPEPRVSVMGGATFSWSNGVPTPIGSSDNTDTEHGFGFEVQAGAVPTTLEVYVVTCNATGTMSASLGAHSTERASAGGDGNRLFRFKISSRGGTNSNVSVRWEMDQGGQIALQAATLAIDDGPADLQNFLERIWFELRNTGDSPQQRARNFVATQAYSATDVIRDAVGRGLNLQQISVVHSPLCRPGSECWDVMFSLFNPKDPSGSALKVHRFTVDVSDVKPVMIGRMFKWNSY